MNSNAASLFHSLPYLFTKDQQRLALLRTSTFDKFLNRGIVITSLLPPLHVRGTRGHEIKRLRAAKEKARYV